MRTTFHVAPLGASDAVRLTARRSGMLKNRRPVEPIPWQFPHSPGYKGAPPPVPVQPGTLPYQKYNKPGKWEA